MTLERNGGNLLKVTDLKFYLRAVFISSNRSKYKILLITLIQKRKCNKINTFWFNYHSWIQYEYIYVACLYQKINLIRDCGNFAMKWFVNDEIYVFRLKKWIWGGCLIIIIALESKWLELPSHFHISTFLFSRH